MALLSCTLVHDVLKACGEVSRKYLAKTDCGLIENSLYRNMASETFSVFEFRKINFGLVDTCEYFSFGQNTCENCHLTSPSIGLSLSGAHILCNLSSSWPTRMHRHNETGGDSWGVALPFSFGT